MFVLPENKLKTLNTYLVNINFLYADFLKNTNSYINKIIPRNTNNTECLESGFSTFGHSDESINSSYKSWFAKDKFNDENIYSNTHVESLTLSKGKATHINIKNNGQSHSVAVDKVILASGSLNTPKILLDSGYKNKHLGQHLKLHPVSGVAGKFSELQNS